MVRRRIPVGLLIGVHWQTAVMYVAVRRGFVWRIPAGFNRILRWIVRALSNTQSSSGWILMMPIWGARDDGGTTPARVSWVRWKPLVSWSARAGMFLHIGMRIGTTGVWQVSIIMRAHIIRRRRGGRLLRRLVRMRRWRQSSGMPVRMRFMVLQALSFRFRTRSIHLFDWNPHGRPNPSVRWNMHQVECYKVILVKAMGRL